MSAIEIIENNIGYFEAISLEEMDAVALMNRTDTKFILTDYQLIDILEKIEPKYRCLDIKGVRLSSYNSQYFDTNNHKFYFQHHRGQAGRIKVRIRKYVESDIAFLEIKRKNKKGDTVKKRVAIDGFKERLEEEQLAFLKESKMPDVDIVPILTNSFKRITLVNKESIERATIDIDLRFNEGNAFDGKKGGLVIIEVKQPGLDRNSPIIKALKESGIRTERVSKYCVGLAKLNPTLKQNGFKSKFLKINKTTG